jgi:outer membrane lipoprotein carrier protein
MELRDAFGNTTLLTFSNIQKNPQLPANAFRFTPPKGADVIKQ